MQLHPPTVLAVDTAVTMKAADRAASGSLYGLNDAQTPRSELLIPLRAKNFTQKAPGGAQRHGGDALVVAPLADRVGGTITVRLADFFPDFPYKWTGEQEWLQIVSSCVAATLAADPPNIYAYEIWNEPNWTWSDEAPPFLEVWTTTSRLIRTLDPSRRTLGPSIERWDAVWMEEFLRHAKTTGTLPDVTSWHVLDPGSADDIAQQMREYRALEESLGIVPRPVSINEYGAIRDVGAPGPLVRFIAALERAEVDTANLAYWHREGRLADLVTADGQPTGAWWLYKWYGEMSGEMLQTSSGDEDAAPDGFASREPDGSLHVVVGERTEWVHIEALDGAYEISCETVLWTGPDGRARNPLLRYKVSAEAEQSVLRLFVPPAIGQYAATRFVVNATTNSPSSPWGQDSTWGNLNGPAILNATIQAGPGSATAVFQSNPGVTDLALHRGLNQVSMSLIPEDGGVKILTTGEAEVIFAEVQPWTIRLGAREAELRFSSLVVVDMRLNAYTAHSFHDDAYISDGAFDSLGSSATWNINVPVTGRYCLTVAYANGGGEVLMWVDIDGERTSVEVPSTQGWGVVGLLDVPLVLKEGPRWLTLNADRRGGRLEYNFVEVRWEPTLPHTTEFTLSS